MPSALYKLGMKTRREVLGDEYVDNAVRNTDEFTRPFQELATEFAWGKIWGSNVIPRKARSFINMAMLVALNRSHELEVHIRGAIRNGCTMEEIREVLMQASVYCGLVAGNDAFRVARKVFDEKA